MRQVALLLLITGALSVTGTGAAQAAITVGNTNDSGQGSLRQAIAEAPPGETIIVPAGDYALTSEELKVEKSLSISGQGAGSTVIRAAGGFRVLYVSGAGTSLTLSDLGIRDGHPTGTIAEGGGLAAREATLTLRGVEVANNTADASGSSGGHGGITEGGGISGRKATITLEGSTVASNIANSAGSDGGGFGGIAEGGGINVREGALTVLSSTFSGNTANAEGGSEAFGGISEGGAIGARESMVTVRDTRVVGNTATSRGGAGKFGGIAAGGGIEVREGPFTIERSMLEGNLADARGGQGPSSSEQFGGIASGAGLHSYANGATTMVDSTVAANVADASGGPGAVDGTAEGGGISLFPTAASIALTEVTVAGNVARTATGTGTGAGGGLEASLDATSTLAVLSATISGNAVEGNGANDKGGNVSVAEGASFANTIVSGGTAIAGSDNCQGPVTSQGFNLESSDRCGFHAAGDQVNRDPLLGPLQENGGPVPTMLPGAAGPAIDQGRSFGLAVDARGVQRPIDFTSVANSAAPGADGSDVGATELQPANTISLGRLMRNRRKGTALLTVQVALPDVGTIVLSGKGLKAQTALAPPTGKLELPIIGTRAVRKALRRRGKRKVQIEVSYTPVASAPAVVARKATLVKRRHHHRRRHHHGRHHGRH
jgi:hypothetical protein